MEKCLTAVKMALDEGVFVTPVISPAVPENSVSSRFALMATHTLDQLDKAIDILTGIFRKL